MLIVDFNVEIYALDRQTDRQKNRQTDRETDIKTNKQTDRQTKGWMNRGNSWCMEVVGYGVKHKLQ